MSHTERFPRRHPLCTCPEWVPSFQLDRPEPDRSQCRGGTIAHPLPLTGDQMQQVVAAFIAQHAEESSQ